MKIKNVVAGSAIFVSLIALGACNSSKQLPDEKDAVNSALTQNNLGVVKVSQDRDKGVMTLSGDVESADQKQQAASVAKSAAPDYTIANEVGVRPVGAESQAKDVDSNLDSAIEDNFKAAIKAHKNLDDQSVSGSAKNGALTVKGTVKTEAQKKEVADLAKKIPNVKQVVNEIEVNNGKHSTPS